MSESQQPVLILGAGINGAAIARELALNGVPVCVVDANDIAYGATSRSSRLIHGGVRYLEYGEFSLVREALEERRRLLRLAPHLVTPLRLFIPVERKWSGWWRAAWKFFGRPVKGPPQPRGLYLMRFGLWLYDWFGKDDLLPGANIYRSRDEEVPPVDAAKYPWLCAFDDAQVSFPERLSVEMLTDARQAAEAAGVSFEVLTHCAAVGDGDTVTLTIRDSGRANSGRANSGRANSGRANSGRANSGRANSGRGRTLQTPLIVNATGAWVDRTLQKLARSAERMIGGAKGSHLLTSHAGLRAALAGAAVYAEASDGRPVFLLPLGEFSMIGTTDMPFDGPPDEAVASEQEQDYLCDTANRVFPSIHLERSDINWHYSGVRPLPYVGEGSSPAATTRRHFIEWLPDAGAPLLSIIGGKITTCRSLAEEAAAAILKKLNRDVAATSRERPLPGGVNYPALAEPRRDWVDEIARRRNIPSDLVRKAASIFGGRTDDVLAAAEDWMKGDADSIVGDETFWAALARYVVRHEWAASLQDVVERRLMLLYDTSFSESCLRRIAAALVQEGQLADADVEQEVRHCLEQFESLYGMSFESLRKAAPKNAAND